MEPVPSAREGAQPATRALAGTALQERLSGVSPEGTGSNEGKVKRTKRKTAWFGDDSVSPRSPKCVNLKGGQHARAEYPTEWLSKRIRKTQG